MIGSLAVVRERLLPRSAGPSLVSVVPLGKDEDPDLASLEDRIGCAALVLDVTGASRGRPGYSLLLAGLCRVRLGSLTQHTPYPVCVVAGLQSGPGRGARAGELRSRARSLLASLDPVLPALHRLTVLLERAPDHQLADLVATLVPASFPERLAILNTVSVEERSDLGLALLERQIAALQLDSKMLVKILRVCNHFGVQGGEDTEQERRGEHRT